MVNSDQEQTLGDCSPGESLVQRRNRCDVPACQFQINGIVESKSVFLSKGERYCQVGLCIGSDGQVEQSVRAGGRPASSNLSASRRDKKTIA